jgi:hypothetical protein
MSTTTTKISLLRGYFASKIQQVSSQNSLRFTKETEPKNDNVTGPSQSQLEERHPTKEDLLRSSRFAVTNEK